MKPLRVYIDTSVFGGYFDDEFYAPTRTFFDLANNRLCTVLVSDLLVEEMENAPPRGLGNSFPGA